MAENIKVRWLVDHEQNKIAPKTLSTQILNEDGTRFKDTVENEITNVETEIVTHASNSDIHVTAEEKEAWSNIEIPSLEGYATEEYVESLVKKLSATLALSFYCIEDVVVIINDVSKTYPANSNVEIVLTDEDIFEIVPTSNNSILSLNAFPGALSTYYPWLEGVKQFSNILFDMNNVDMYSKWSQGNQGAYQVQFAQYVNCVFWSDNPYISDVTKRTNYTLCSTSQLPLCYSTIPDNTFKSFYLAFGVNSDPNWSNPLYKESFAKATWATQAFSYYGARIVGFPGHDSSNFTIPLPKDCRGLMFDARNIECAGTFDAINTTNFGAKSGSWREAFGDCPSLRRLYIKNLKVNLNISWSPIDYNSISYIISKAANTNAITISVSPYTYNLLSDSDFELATSKNITIELLTTNYVEDRRLGEIANKANKDEIVQSDWNQNDETAADFVKNKTHWIEQPEYSWTLESSSGWVSGNDLEFVTLFHENYENFVISESSIYFFESNEPHYVVNLTGTEGYEDDTIYSYAFKKKSNNAAIIFVRLFHNNGILTGEYSIGEHSASWSKVTITTNDNHGIVHTLDEKFIPDTIARISDTKQKDLIITYVPNNTMYATHSVDEINQAISEGRSVYFQKDAELFDLLEVTSDYATFLVCYVNMNGKLQQKVVAMSGNSIMLEQDDIYNYATVDQLNNTLQKTAQTLTDSELTQVRKNLKFIGKDLEGQTFTIDGTEVTAAANAEIFGDYENNIAVGQWSIAEGSGTVAKGRASHAEGAMTKALADGTHTEGYQTEATGYWSHAEGEMTKVTSYASHAEGSYCTMPDGTKRYGTASGYASHVEGGGCHATGSCSHAEGLATMVSGNQSHVEGRYTTAAGSAQHVEGTGNVVDTDSQYIHIAGNGDYGALSNAHTLDWSGNAWFSGNVYVGSTSGINRDEGSKKLLVEDDILITVDDIDAICGVLTFESEFDNPTLG